MFDDLLIFLSNFFKSFLFQQPRSTFLLLQEHGSAGFLFLSRHKTFCIFLVSFKGLFGEKTGLIILLNDSNKLEMERLLN